jgi:hypothetical protein
MTKLPPFLPEETLRRVLRVARLDGLSVAFVAGVFALISALAGDGIGAITGLLVAGAGAIELHGASLLVHHDARGMKWLVNSQLVLLLTVLGYCALHLTHSPLPDLPSEVDVLIQQDADQLGMTKQGFLQLFNRMLYGGVAGATLLYQGGMALYYWRRREAVARALETET